MDRNIENHFSHLPANIDIRRSRFRRPFDHKTTLNTGDLIPLYVDEILPGDTVNMDMAMAVRMSTPIYPVMDNAYLDTYWFFVPNRLVWEHWKEFNGENNTTYWEQPIEYTIPQITAPEGGWKKGTLADYMGLPTQKDIEVNALFGRAYTLIWNEWFRDQNVQPPIMVPNTDTTQTGDNENPVNLGKPAKVNKYHDYFTSALPAPLKGPDVMLPLGNEVPVVGNGKVIGLMTGAAEGRKYWGMDYIYNGSNNLTISPSILGQTLPSSAPTDMPDMRAAIGLSDNPENSGMVADLSLSTGATINQLRQAFAIQRLYERDARGGTRYTEILRSHFGVVSPDARLQRPEYLGGTRVNINMSQVVQTSSTNETSPQGNTAAFSLTNAHDGTWTQSFTEHGILMCVAAIRTDHTYQQGIERMWSRKDRFDFYWPALANIGEQAVLNKEIYVSEDATDEEVFGYQEAWAEYRYKPSRVSGAFRSNYQQSLDMWHYADDYETRPTLSEDWMFETRNNVNRTLAVQDSLEDQFIGDFYFMGTWTRPMPLYSIPGLLDHN